MLAVIILIINVVFLYQYLINSKFDENGFLIPKFFDDSFVVYDDDVGLLADKTSFKYLIPDCKCKFEGSNPSIIIAINSNSLAKKMRQTIRDSWGKYDKNVQTIFFLGAVESDQIQKEIEDENKEFNDIVQGNFIDTQRNLGYKHLMIFKWCVENCSRLLKYVIKIDDDVFANVPAIVDFLAENKNSSNFLMGVYHSPELCPRLGDAKVTFEEYASDYYPAYAERHSIIYSIDVAAKLFYKSHLVEYFWVEDVYVTGILRSQINVEIEPSDKYILSAHSLAHMRERSVNLPNPTNFMFSPPNLTVQDQLLLWERTEWYRLGEKTTN